MTQLRIRKSVCDLTISDLEQFSAWEFALDEEGEKGQDETTVRPYLAGNQVDPADGMFVVRATFQFKDGTSACGYLTPRESGDTSLSTTQPVVVTPCGQVAFWCGIIGPTHEHLVEQYRRLARARAAVFPIKFRSAIPLVGGAVTGEIPGFVVVTDLKTMSTRIER